MTSNGTQVCAQLIFTRYLAFLQQFYHSQPLISKQPGITVDIQPHSPLIHTIPNVMLVEMFGTSRKSSQFSFWTDPYVMAFQNILDDQLPDSLA